MRSKKAIRNSLTAILAEIVSVICGFILPRLILSAFGSSYNGITSSISQFISCVVLLRAGVGGVTRAALYKPLADNDTEQISRVIKATEIFMKKVSMIFAASLVVLACIYPWLVNDEFEWLFTFSLVLILGISTFSQNYFGITYQMLIQADQRQYIYSLLTIVTTILNTIVAAGLIMSGATIHLVKLGSAVVFTINPIFLNLYVKKRYKLNRNAEPDNSAISQRWSAFAQQVAAFVNNNTDVMVLTAFCNIKEVSVYTVYHMVTNGLYKVEKTVCDGMGAAFGNMMAKKEEDALQRNIKLFELLVFSSSAVLFICGGNLITSFAVVYTHGVTDVSYERPLFGTLMCVNQFLFCIRLPYQMLVEAAGKFKQTRNGAIFESVLNIVLSVLLVAKYGIIGVSVGTFCALAFRTWQYSTYASKNILHRSMSIVVKRILVSILEAVVISIIVRCLPFGVIDGYFTWFGYAMLVFVITAGIVCLCSAVFFKEELILLADKIYGMFVGMRKKKS